MNRIKKHSILTTITSWLLCTLFIFQIVNRTVYLHSHKDIDGRIIIHAHPYNKSTDSSPLKKHHHTSFQFALLAQMEILFFIPTILYSIFNIFKKYIFIIEDIHNCFNGFIYKKAGRSPPSLY